MAAYAERYGEPIRRINCSRSDELSLIRLMTERGEGDDA